MQQLNWIRQINSPLRKDISGLSRQWEMSSQNHQEKRNLERSSGPTLCLRQNCSLPLKTKHQPMELPEISGSPVPPHSSTSGFNPKTNTSFLVQSSLLSLESTLILWFIIFPSSEFIPHSNPCLFISYFTSPPPKETHVGTSGSLPRISESSNHTAIVWPISMWPAYLSWCLYLPHRPLLSLLF